MKADQSTLDRLDAPTKAPNSLKNLNTFVSLIVSSYPLYDAAETMYAIGASISKAMGGTTGIMYNLLCKAAYAELKKDNIDEEVTPRDWSEALKASIASVRKYGGATEGYRTMLDALIPASQVLEENLSAGVDPVTAFSVSAVAATKGAKSTIQMQAQAGRLSAENLATVPDPGAMAAAVWYRAARAVRKKQHLKPYGMVRLVAFFYA
uniref:DhaL domain-containing protein n=1 Tax=Brassica campestris TaxID=3711 RepID=A0A3P5YZ69_BRACM|nr:unnamed protein product [Brassica rapa]